MQPLLTPPAQDDPARVPVRLESLRPAPERCPPKALLAALHQSHGLLCMASYAVTKGLAEAQVCTYLADWRAADRA